MKITMISNYINHHQIPFCEAMYDRIGSDFVFIQTMEMEQKRIEMGWAVDPDTTPYVMMQADDYEKAKKVIDDCDLLLVGWIEDESIILDRLSSGKPVLRISERLYREGQWRAVSPKGLMRKYKDHIKYRKLPVYLLCNGAYVASDYNLIHAYPGKKYRFGYFPKSYYYYDPAELFRRKGKLEVVVLSDEAKEELPLPFPTVTKKEIKIIWAGRFLELKHPEYMVKLASELVALGYRFHIHMVGSGDMEESLKAQAEYELIDEYITFHGFMAPERVRELMEDCHIHIFTSNYLEGWGAVVNEGMNAGCAEVVSAEAGAGPYLIESRQNGLLYADSKYENMKEQVLKLFSNPSLIWDYGKAAYDTIANEWNAEIAADRIFDFYDGYMKGEINPPKSGPMSVAPNIKPKFFVNGRLKE